MTAKQLREARKRHEQNGERYDFEMEKEHLPLVHSGFTEATTDDLNVSSFFVSIWYSNGAYRLKLLDREAKEKAFLITGTLVDCLDKLERALSSGDLDWVPDEPRRNGRFGT